MIVYEDLKKNIEFDNENLDIIVVADEESYNLLGDFATFFGVKNITMLSGTFIADKTDKKCFEKYTFDVRVEN